MRTSSPSRLGAALAAVLTLLRPLGWAATPDFSWLTAPTLPTAKLQAALDDLSASPRAASDTLQALARPQTSLSLEGQSAVLLLTAAAHERGGDTNAACRALRDLAAKADAGSPFHASASFRLRVLETIAQPEADLRKLYKQLAAEADRPGWYLVSSRWVGSTSRRAACQSLVELRADRLSFRLFAWLRAKSFFPPEYAYLFVLSVLALGTKMLQLPLLVRQARMAAQIRALQPQVEQLRAVEGHDPERFQRRVMELYRERGITLAPGCLVALADLVFVIWAFVVLSDFSAQMVLDGARFWWVEDVTRFNWGLVGAWGGASVLLGLFSASAHLPLGQMFAGSVVTSLILGGIAKHWDWPAYVFVFWTLLSLLSGVIGRVLQAIQAFVK